MRDGLARLVLELGTEAEACVEMMSGAVWVRDRLQSAGWQMKVAHARKVRDVAPLACKTDRVDARVLAELCRRDLVPELWVPSIEDRALRERLRRRMHLVKTRTAARNRIFGLLTQFGLRISYPDCRKPGAMELLEGRGVPEVWRASIVELLELAAEMDRRIIPLDRELAPLARSDERARLLATMPGVGPAAQPHLRRGDRRGLSLPGARQADRLRGLAPRISQSGERSQTGRALQGRLEDPSLGGGRGREPGLAAGQPLARALPAGEGAARQEPGEVLGRPQALDRRLAHAHAPRALQRTCPGELLLLSDRLTVLHGIERPRQLPGTICAPSAEREMSTPHPPAGSGTSTTIAAGRSPP